MSGQGCLPDTGQASSGLFGVPVFASAGKTVPPSLLILSQTSAGNRMWCYVIACSLSVQFLCSCQEAVPSFSNRGFFRPDRRFRTPARAEAVKVGRRSAVRHTPTFPGRALTASSTTADWMITGRKSARFVEFGPFVFRSRGLMSLPDPPFSTRSRVAGRNMASGFRCRYVPNALEKRACTKNRAVIEARPGRDNIPPRDAAKGIRSTSGGWRGSLSVPLERCAGGPHAVQDDSKLAGNRHGCRRKQEVGCAKLSPHLTKKPPPSQRKVPPWETGRPAASPRPWRADTGGYLVRDANSQALTYIYSRDSEAEALQAKVLTKDRRGGSPSISRVDLVPAQITGLGGAQPVP
jgi:hypothetical protein